MRASKAREHLELVGTLTDEPPRAPFPSEGSHGHEGQAAGPESYTCANNEQPTSPSRVDNDGPSVQAERSKMEGTNRRSYFAFYDPQLLLLLLLY